MCCSGSSASLSRLGISVGLLSLITLVTAFVSNVWLYTKEPITLPNSQVATTITFRIGLWRVCPSLKRPNFSLPVPSPACTLIKYSTWDEIKDIDLGVFWSPLEFTPNFVTRMRISMPFGAVALVLVLLATLCAMLGHCNSDQKTLFACGLYTLGGLSLAGGLLVFASVLSDAYLDRPRSSNMFTKSVKNNSLTFDYRYGWSFFAAGAAFVMSEIAALLSITAYMRRFPSVEDMVRIMVPGADRKLRQHYLYNDCVVRRNAEQEPGRRKVEVPVVPNKTDGQLVVGNKTPPDICTYNNKNDAEDTKVVEYPNLAGTTVPITLMHHKPPVPYSNHLPVRQQNNLICPKQDFRYATIGHCTLVHQGVLGVSEGAPGTSSSSGSTASSGGVVTSTGSSTSARSFQPVPRVRRKTAISSGFMTLDSTRQLGKIVPPSPVSQSVCSSGSAV